MHSAFFQADLIGIASLPHPTTSIPVRCQLNQVKRAPAPIYWPYLICDRRSSQGFFGDWRERNVN